MAGHKIDRLTSDFTFQLAGLIRELKDPRVTGCMLSVVRVEITNDLSYATAYVGAMEGLEAAKNAVKGLQSASGYLKRELSARIKMRKMPELRFVADDSIEHSAHIARVLESLNLQEEKADD